MLVVKLNLPIYKKEGQMAAVVGIRLAPERLERLQRAARALNQSVGEMAGLLVEEGLRLREFPGLEFRDTPIGRQAFLAGTRLGVWQVAAALPDYGGQTALLAEGLGLTTTEAAAALAYAQAYPVEVEAAIADSLALNRRIEALVAPLRADEASRAGPAGG
jgi:uncharacterized protein (DUF433 family)